MGHSNSCFDTLSSVEKGNRISSKMNSLTFCLLLATSLAVASAGIEDIVDVHSGNANDYADQLLKKLRVRILNEGLDPLILPVKSFEFYKKILLVEVRGSAKVYDGYLKGLSTLHRTGLASMNSNGTHITVRATIGVNDLTGSYKASAKFMNLGPSFGINLFMESVGITFEVLKSVQPDSRPTLLSFQVVDLGEIKTELDGNFHILDFVINKFNNFVINIVKDFVIGIISIPLKKIVQNVLNTADLPDITSMRY